MKEKIYNLIISKNYAITLGIFRIIFSMVFFYTLIFIYSSIDYEVTAVNPTLLKFIVLIEMIVTLFVFIGFAYEKLKYIYVLLGILVQYLLFESQTPVLALFFVNSFLLMQHLFLPLSRTLSVDKLLSIEPLHLLTIRNYNYLFPLFIMGLIYFDGGVNKLLDAEWTSSSEYFFQLEYTSSVVSSMSNISDNFISNFLVGHPIFNSVLLKATIVYQLIFIVVIFLRFNVKKWFLLFGIFSHIGIIILFDFWIVSFAILSLYLFSIPPKNIYRVFILFRKYFQNKSINIIIYYDSTCNICSRYIFLIKIFDFLNHIKLIGKDLSAEKDIIVSINGESFRGVEGFKELFKKIIYFKFLYYLLNFSLINTLANKIYIKFAQRRATVSCKINSSYVDNYDDYKVFILINVLVAILLRTLSGESLTIVRNFSQISGIAPSLTIFLAGKEPTIVIGYLVRVEGKEILPYQKREGIMGHITYNKGIGLAFKEKVDSYTQEDMDKFRYIHYLEDSKNEDIEICIKVYDFHYKAQNVTQLREIKDKRVKESKIIYCTPLKP